MLVKENAYSGIFYVVLGNAVGCLFFKDYLCIIFLFIENSPYILDWKKGKMSVQSRDPRGGEGYFIIHIKPFQI